MNENDKKNTIEENESNDGVKGQNKQVICMMHPVALVIIVLFIIGAIMKMCGYDDEEDANGSSNANSTAAYAKDSTVDDSTVVTKEWVYESDGGSASCSLEGNKKVVGNIGETSVIFIRGVAPDCSDLIVLKGDPLPLTSSTKEGKLAGTIRISFGFGGEDYRVIAMDGMYATQPSDMLLKKLFTEKSMTVKLPSGDKVDFNLPDFKDCSSHLQAFMGTKCNSF